jgi:hypothetical protein
MSTKHLHITGNMSNQTLKINQDNLDITVNHDCNWCFSDPQFVFGNPSTLLAQGTYSVTNPHTTYGPYTPVKTGTVHFNAVTSGECDPNGDMDTGHTIIVTN